MGKPLRIALLSHQVNRHDGQGRVTYEIATAALARDFEVHLLAVTCDPELARHPRVRLVLIDHEKLPTQLLRNLAFAMQSARWLRKHGHSIDMIQVNGFITWASSDVNVAHFVHGAWSSSPYYPFRNGRLSAYTVYQRLFTALNVQWEKGAFSRTRAIVSVSERVRQELKSIHVPLSGVTVIHNGVDTGEFCPGDPERDRFLLPGNVPLFLFAGDIRTPRKNLGTVLHALASSPGVHLAVAGKLQGSPYPALAAQLGISDRVHFLDIVHEMPRLMRSVDGFVFPSHYDPLGLVILEAMASGLPVITSRMAGGAELLGSAGLILDDPDDVERLSAWLASLANDKALCRKLGAAARAAALSNTWSRMASRYLDLYQRLCST